MYGRIGIEPCKASLSVKIDNRDKQIMKLSNSNHSCATKSQPRVLKSGITDVLSEMNALVYEKATEDISKSARQIAQEVMDIIDNKYKGIII